MANRTGRGSNIVKLNRTTGISGSTPVVRYNRVSTAPSNAGADAFALGDVLQGISRRFEDRLDIQAEAEAIREGSLAGAADELPTLQDEATIRGRAFNAAAKDAALLRYDLEGRRAVAEYEEKHKIDPAGFMRNSQAYLKGQVAELEKLDPRLAQRYGAEFESRAMAAEARIKDRHTQVVRDRQLEQTLRSTLAIQDELAVDAANLFTGSAEDAQATMSRMMSNSAKMIDAANQIGPDGRPLYSARERVSMERQAQQAIAQQIGGAWMSVQQNHLQAFNDWRSGKASIRMIDQDGKETNVNLKDMLGERGYQMAQEGFMDKLRSEISLQNQLEAQNDRAFQKSSDALFADMTVMAQDGALDLQTVEMAKRSLEPKHYVALRQIAKGGFATVDDGDTMMRLMEKDANGEDITDELNAARGQLTQQTYTQLYGRNSTRVDRGTVNPVDMGRDYLTRSLGSLSKTIGNAQSMTIAGASSEYEMAIENFQVKEGRQPTLTEARTIAEDLVVRFAIADSESTVIALPLPRAMSSAEKFSKTLSTADIETKLSDTKKTFLEMHGGNEEAMKSDPNYQREIKLLKKYHDVLTVKEKARNGQ